MSKERRTGDDRLTTTSVHLPCAYLDRIEELKRPQSEYIREAVGEKLERDEGFTAEIERLLVKERNMELELKILRKDIDAFHDKHQRWKIGNEKNRARDLAMELYVEGTYATEQDLLLAVQKQGLFEVVEEILPQIVHDVWSKAKGAD